MRKYLVFLLVVLTALLPLTPTSALESETFIAEQEDPSTADAYDGGGDVLLGSGIRTETLDIDTNYVRPSASEAYSKMIACKADYPEGMSWTNDNKYVWYNRYTDGGVTYNTYTGGGCVAFCMILADAAYSTNAMWLQVNEFTYEDIQVGDMVRCNNGSHSVTILEKHDDYVVIAEGNYNSSIHWGREITKSKLMSMSTYIVQPYAYVHTPTAAPTVKPTATPTAKPTATPTAKPTVTPTPMYTEMPTPMYTEMPTVSPTICTAELKKGDVDGNGSINAADASKILRYLVGLDTISGTQYDAADTDGDGSVKAGDASAILRHLVGLD